MSDYYHLFNHRHFCWRCGKMIDREGSICRSCYEEFCEMINGGESEEQELIKRGYVK